MTHIIQYQDESMEEDEAAFITRRYKHESKLYLRTMNVFLALAAFTPMVFCIIIIFARKDMTMQKVLFFYFVGLLFMLLFVGLIAFVSYRVKVWGLYRDHLDQIKRIEKAIITQKRAMKLNGTYHFYLSSPTLYTIEVGADDFTRLELGDEVNIEYAKNSKEYFGYF